MPQRQHAHTVTDYAAEQHATAFKQYQQLSGQQQFQRLLQLGVRQRGATDIQRLAE